MFARANTFFLCSPLTQLQKRGAKKNKYNGKERQHKSYIAIVIHVVELFMRVRWYY